MAAITSNAVTGFFDSTSSWPGGVVPGAGDTYTIATGAVITMRDARTVGVSPAAGAATKAIQCDGTLILGSGAALVCRGDIGVADDDNFQMQGGSSLTFDAHLASSPSTALYTISSTKGGTFGRARIKLIGSSGNRLVVTSNSGGANGRIAFADEGEIDAQYVDFSRIGDASHPAYTGYATNGHKLSFIECSLDANCGKIAGGGDNAAIFNYVNVTHLGADSLSCGAGSTFSGGTRLIDGCRFKGDVQLNSGTGFTITGDTIFEGVIDFAGVIASWVGNMLAVPATVNGFAVPAATVKDTPVVFIGNPTNLHGFGRVDGVSSVFDGLIFDGPNVTDGVGDCITMDSNPASAQSITIKNSIVAKTKSGTQVGTLVSMLGGANLTLLAEHNTYFIDGIGGIYVGEGYSGHSGMVTARDNIAWNDAGNTALAIRAEATVVQDVVLSADANHNGLWNKLGTGYDPNLTFSSGTPGTGDIAANPGFPDPLRNIETWDTSLGGPGTTAHALDEMRKKNDPTGYNSNYSPANYRNYMRTGVAVSNASMRTGAHDGTVMGANQDAPPPTGGPFPFFTQRQGGMRGMVGMAA